MNLDKIVAAVKQGVAMAGGTPIVFTAIAVCDGIAIDVYKRQGYLCIAGCYDRVCNRCMRDE